MTNHNRSGRPVPGDVLTAEAIADLAHELRSPLGGIEAMVDLLATTTRNPDQEQVIDGLKAAAAHLRAVAADLIGSGKAGQKPRKSVAEVLAAFAVASRARASAKGLRFVDSIDDWCGEVTATDSVAMRQILENLVDNAFRLTADGEIAFNATPVDRTNPARGIRLELCDNGPGLSADESALVFQRGTMLPGRVGGTGLGLSIVADIASRLGGRCGATSQGAGCGATFWVELPVMAMERSNAAAADFDPERDSARPILIVEDDAASRALLDTVLSHLGFTCISCPSPVEALDLLKERAVLAVMTDFAMPGMDGSAFVAAIRAMAGSVRQIPVIAVTGRVDPESKAQLLAAGCSDIVEKPLTIHDLRQALFRTNLLDNVRKAKAA